LGEAAILVIRPQLWIGILAVFAIAGCASFNAVPIDEVGFLARSQTQQQGGVSVTVAVPSAEESKMMFGIDLYKNDIQPVWLEISNNDDDPMILLPAILDPEYFTPLEAAATYRFSSAKDNTALDYLFTEQAITLFVPPGETRSGFVFTNLDEGSKGFVVDLIGADQEYRNFTFFVAVPGLRVDHENVNFAELHAAVEIVDHDHESLRHALEELPCCVTNKSGKGSGDPLNLVVIGEPWELWHAFIRAGWDETETIYGGSLWKTAKSFTLGGRYRYSPVSALYVFGRGQDVALQKARNTIHERNHLRLWMTPMRVDGKPVWVGQISRDLGVRFTKKTITTHKIDPDVDEARNYLIQDLWYSQGLSAYGYVAGVEAASFDEPRANLTGDRYFTDGLRALMWLSSEPLNMEEVQFIHWEIPRAR
jgi:hypothetical protein